MGIENNFSIGGDEIKVYSTKIADIELGIKCTNYIADNLVPQGEPDQDATCDNFTEVQDVGPDNDNELIDE